MNNYKIYGGSPLFGSITASGSKNICLGIMAGALLCKGKTVLTNVPNITDVDNMVKVISSLGVKCEFTSPNTLEIDATEIKNVVTEYKYVSKMRASFNVLGPILARKGHAAVSRPGGCNIGDRPIDLHVLALKKLGARTIENLDKIEMSHNGLVGTTIGFDTVTVGGTQHAITASCLANGETKIINAAVEPEVTVLIDFLNQCGANIVTDNQNIIYINGVKEMTGTEFRIPFDRIEAGTYISFAAMTKGDIIIEDIIPSHLYSFLYKMEEIGINVEIIDDNKVRIKSTERLKAANMSTSVFPGFATDLQPAYTTLMTTAKGVSRITENIFNGRFKFLSELQRMGAIFDYISNTAIVTGVESLSGVEISSPDLRGGTALICAGLGAKGVTTLYDPNGFIKRGYENIIDKITALKGNIKEFNETKEEL